MYTNWMTQNGINILGMRIDAPTAHAIGGTLSALTGAATGSVDSIGSGIGSMFGAVHEQYRASMIPNQIGGQTTVGDVTFAYDKLAPTYYKMQIREENARIIDDWFTRFGYKINRVKLPNITGRLNFNYVEIGQNDEIGQGNIPFKYMEEINQAARKGVTIWHNHENIGNFSVTNTIVTPS